MINKHQELIDFIKKDCLAQLTESDFLQSQENEPAFRKKIEAMINVSLKHKGDSSLNAQERQMILAQVISDITGLGPIEKMFHEPQVSEVMVNGPKQIYVEKNGRLELSNVTFRDEQHLEYFVEKILAPLGRHVTEAEPYIDARLPDGSRVNVVRHPISLIGTVLTIRKFSRKILTMEDLVERKSLSQAAGEFLSACVRARMNIIISGGSGAGKTTMLNVLSNFIPQDQRVVSIEDIAELQLKGRHIVRMEARPANIEGKGEINIRKLLKNALHMRPDRIIVGEVRSSEILDMLQAMTTGHEGSMATVHANSALEALDRLEILTLMDNPNFSSSVAKRHIISAIDIIAHMTRLPDGSRKVSQISEVSKENRNDFKLQDIFYAGDSNGFEMKFTGNIPLVYDRLNKQTGFSSEAFKSNIKNQISK